MCVGPRTEEMSSVRRAELVGSLHMGDGSVTEDQQTSLVLRKGDRSEVDVVTSEGIGPLQKFPVLTVLNSSQLLSPLFTKIAGGGGGALQMSPSA